MSTGPTYHQQGDEPAEAPCPLLKIAFDQLVNQIDDVFWLYNCESQRVEYVSPAYERIWGRSAARLLADPLDGINSAVVPEHREAVRREFLASLAGGRFESTYRIRLPDGDERWIHDRGFAVRDQDGRVVRVAGVARDITERKLAKDRLRESEVFLRATLDALPANIAILDERGAILAVNWAWRMFAEQNGLNAPNHAVGMNYLNVCDAAVGRDAGVAREVARSMRAVLAGREPALVLTYACDAPNEPRWFELRVARFEADGWTLLVAAHLDVTARMLAEEQTARQQAELAHIARVATIGEMAAGIAHELNQPLAAIANYAEGCLDRLPRADFGPDELLDALQHIRNLAKTSGAIIRRLRAAARKSEPRRSSTCLNAVAREAVELVRYELKADGVALELRLADNLPLVQADAVQIQQVLLNLLLNAHSALRGATQPRVTVTTRRESHTVLVSVIDNGPGFDGADPERMFESFYSSKPDGLGLGLPISRAIVQAHGGRIWAERVHEHSCFHFTIPCPPPDVAAVPRSGTPDIRHMFRSNENGEAVA